MSSADLLLERFPLLALSSMGVVPKPFRRKHQVIDTENLDSIYVMGLDRTSYKEYKEWLHGDPTRRLIFLEKNPSFIAQFVLLPESEEMLKNSQVFIQQEVNENHTERVEVVGSARDRLKILRDIALRHALYIDRLHGYQVFENFVKNAEKLPKSFYANSLKDKFQGVPAIVCGAGPSLEVEEIKRLSSGALVIAGGSTIAALSLKGLIPHFGMAIDPNLEEYERLKNCTFEMPLLYSTRMHHKVLDVMPGPHFYMRSGIGGAPELFLEEELGLTEELIGKDLDSEAISVTTIAVAFASYLGCSPILLNGIDMAYTNNQHYAPGVNATSPTFSAIEAEKRAPHRLITQKGKRTAIRWLMESSAISRFAGKEFINTSPQGLGFKTMMVRPLSSFSFPPQNLKEKIRPTRLPASITEPVAELKESLIRTIALLESLVINPNNALAELDLQSELATSILFYDAPTLFPKNDWKSFLNLAQKYLLVWN